MQGLSQGLKGAQALGVGPRSGGSTGEAELGLGIAGIKKEPSCHDCPESSEVFFLANMSHDELLEVNDDSKASPLTTPSEKAGKQTYQETLFHEQHPVQGLTVYWDDHAAPEVVAPHIPPPTHTCSAGQLRWVPTAGGPPSSHCGGVGNYDESVEVDDSEEVSSRDGDSSEAVQRNTHVGRTR